MLEEMEMKGQHLKICLACANIYAVNDTEVLECPYCGSRISAEKYESVLHEARQALHYGWTYRLQYEKELKERGRIDIYYDLAPYDEIFSFIALAAASGVVGGFAYDIVKKVIAKIAKFVKQNGGEEEKREVSSLLSSKEEMKKLFQYIDEYYRGFEGIDEEVRSAVLEEMIVDEMSAELVDMLQNQSAGMDMEKIKEVSPFSKEKILKSTATVKKQIEMRKQKKNPALQNLWENLDE